MAGWKTIAVGIVLLIIGIILLGVSNSISNECNSFPGHLGGILGIQNQETCAMGEFMFIVGLLLVIIGLVLIMFGAVSRIKKQEQPKKYVEQQNHTLTSLCRFCGRSILQNSKFCSHCGKNLSSTNDVVKKCGHCHATMSQDSEYCANCGSKF